MNYELAKQLKDAGFPQDKGLLEASKHGRFMCEGKGSVYLDGELWENHGAFRDEVYTSYSPFKEALYIPTLEEAIEACGDCGLALIQMKNMWEAYSGYSEDDYTLKFFGKTPLEAVCRLWLAGKGAVPKKI